MPRLFSERLLFWVALSLAIYAGHAQSPFRMSLDRLGGQLVVGIEGEPEHLYSIQTCEGFSAADVWLDQALIRTDTDGRALGNVPAPAAKQRFYRAATLSAPMDTNLIFIPPGTFMMGSPSNEADRFPDEGPQRSVTIGSGFWVGRYLVTYRDYRNIVGTNGQTPTELSLPAQVFWRDATNYCALLTEIARATGHIPEHTVYRLPTEAEWEYACRAGTITRFSYGDDPGYTNLDSYAWNRRNSGEIKHPVGQRLPNPWGLYDMHGNVWEWCQDDYRPYPGGTARTPPNMFEHHVLRGGSCQDNPSWCRSARRYYATIDFQYLMSYGFRVVLAPEIKTDDFSTEGNEGH